MIVTAPPHTSCRYAIIRSAVGGRLLVAAVHAVNPYSILASPVIVNAEHPTWYLSPEEYATERVVTFAANLKAAGDVLRWHASHVNREEKP